jgi:hypothetical protein
MRCICMRVMLRHHPSRAACLFRSILHEITIFAEVKIWLTLSVPNVKVRRILTPYPLVSLSFDAVRQHESPVPLLQRAAFLQSGNGISDFGDAKLSFRGGLHA